jgi:hypothetical protein
MSRLFGTDTALFSSARFTHLLSGFGSAMACENFFRTSDLDHEFYYSATHAKRQRLPTAASELFLPLPAAVTV